ncbi:MAG TPA: DUF389 domain-containing protein [Candidatus Nanopelagicales bacterium]|nr:DUF389 domain-containing protein [Candidatus Nanopelagicales bacterium]
MRFSPVGLLFDDGKKITPVADVEDQVYLLTRHSGNDRLFRFSALLILSAVIATGGVLLDSTATVIGAMIVAPLAWPIQGVGLAIVQARIGQVQRSASILGFAVIAVVVVGLLIALAVPDELSPINNSQIATRTAPNLLDLFVAIATGTVGAFAVSRSDLSGVLPGVAIAISLVPPLAVAGVVLSEGDFLAAVGALTLFLANAIAIVICCLIVFTIAGYKGTGDHSLQKVRRPITIVITILTALVIALAAFTARSLIGAIEQQRVQSAATAWLKDSNYTLVDVQFQRGQYVVQVLGNGQLPSKGDFQQAFSPVLWLEPTIKIEAVTGSTETIDLAGSQD